MNINLEMLEINNSSDKTLKLIKPLPKMMTLAST